MNLPEFSVDGVYLEVHNIKEIYSKLGSREDDYRNFFSARMLLLLESKAIHNEKAYDSILMATLERYFSDFNKHESDFKPVFLVNDVIRFWRTLCLNYEHNRNRKFDIPGLGDDERAIKKNEAHVKNLKLKFSRKLTCYSFLLCLMFTDDVLKQEDILEIVKLTPLKRLERLARKHEVSDDVENPRKITKFVPK